PGAPVIPGLQVLSAVRDGSQVVALFAVQRPGVYALQVAGADATTSGDYTVQLDVAGDINGDAKVDGADSKALAAAPAAPKGDAAYNPAADITGHGVIDANDRQVPIDHYGFRADPPAPA